MRTPRAMVFGAVAVSALIVGITAALPAQKPPIKLAVVESITGPYSVIGTQDVRGAVLEMQILNARGGINGRRIALKVVDDQSSPNQAVQLTRSLIDSWKPDAIIGSTATGPSLAMKPTTEQAGVIQYSGMGAAIPYPAPYFFAMNSPPSRWLADLPLYWAKSQGITSVGCVASSDASGQVFASQLQAASAASGVSVSVQTFNLGDSDVTTQLTKLRSAGVGLIYTCTTGPGVATILLGMRQLGMNLPVWVGSSGANFGTAHLIAGILPDKGAFTSGSAIQVYQSLPKSYPHYAKLVAFANAYRKKYGGPADIFAAETADRLAILASAIGELPPGASSSQVVAHLEANFHYQGVALNYHFTRADHRGTDLEGIVEKYLINGTFQMVKSYKSSAIPHWGH